jgi:hypothetical protein
VEYLLSTDDLLVIGPPSQITVDLDLGATGKRGSRVFANAGIPDSSFVTDNDVLPYDLYINTDSYDKEYKNIYQYIINPTNTGEWIKLISLDPNQFNQNTQLVFSDGEAIQIISVAAIAPQNTTLEEEHFSVTYSVENQNPIATSIDSVTVQAIGDLYQLVITIKAIEYSEGSWVPLSGTRTGHFNIRVV